MNATITTTGQEISGKTIKDIRGQLMRMLKIDGPRGLTAVTDSGTEIHVELYDGQDYIRRAASELGRKGGSATSRAKAKAARANGKKGGRPKKQITD